MGGNIRVFYQGSIGIKEYIVYDHVGILFSSSLRSASKMRLYGAEGHRLRTMVLGFRV